MLGFMFKKEKWLLCLGFLSQRSLQGSDELQTGAGRWGW